MFLGRWKLSQAKWQSSHRENVFTEFQLGRKVIYQKPTMTVKVGYNSLYVSIKKVISCYIESNPIQLY